MAETAQNNLQYWKILTFFPDDLMIEKKQALTTADPDH